MIHVCGPKCRPTGWRQLRCKSGFPFPVCEKTHADPRGFIDCRLTEEDRWVVPHNLYLTVFSLSSVNVLGFDPQHGCDQARNYSAKYASKPEAWYYLETVRSELQNWLK